MNKYFFSQEFNDGSLIKIYIVITHYVSKEKCITIPDLKWILVK